ncbi:hypothetical protein, partial [Pseudomonas corrugata]|uniref:hypothetical protein n=1 Tax=Pseudomonas corrugata TaxID=47879 RepID=UPI003D9B4393
MFPLPENQEQDGRQPERGCMTLPSITSPSGVPQMAFFTAASKADFQHQLQAVLAQHI